MINTTTRIQLIDGLSGYLDVKEGVSVPLNFSISDIRDITKKNGSFSKTIVLAGTKNNNMLLNNYFEVNIMNSDVNFNINKKVKCQLIQSGIIILDNAYLTLENCKKVQNNYNEDDLVEYEVQIKDTIGDFFNTVGSRELTDIDLGDMDHIYTAQNVVDSFSHSVVDGYKYILPWIDDTTYIINECKPAVYTKTYFDRIHENAGYSYQWSGNTASNIRFDKLIIPFNGDEKKITEDYREELEVIAENTTPTEYKKVQNVNGTTMPFVKPMTIPTEIKDLQGYYNPTLSRWVSALYIPTPNTLDYEFEVEYELILRVVPDLAYPAYNVNLVAGGRYRPYISVVKNSNISSSVNINLTDLYTVFTDPQSSPTFTVLVPGDNIIQNTTVVKSASLTNIYITDYLDFNCGVQQDGFSQWIGENGEPVRVDMVLNIKSINVKIIPSSDTLIFSFPVFMNNFIPKKIKQSDFLKSIYTMFNLFVEVDVNNPNNLIYKSRDEFYDNGADRNWEKKLARDKEQLLQFLPDLTQRKTVLTYKQDSDVSNKAYFDTTNEVYGQLEYVFENENLKGEDKKEIIFSPTPMQPTSFGSINPLYPTISPKCNIRILLDNGNLNCGNYYIENYPTSTVLLNKYPFCSHLDKVTNPSFDINFGVCDFYFYNIDNYTHNNLYTNYWRRTMGQMNNGKLMTAYFYLRERDIQKMKLSDKIRVDNSYWNINKIIDYNAGSRGLTKVELISVDNDIKFGKFSARPTVTTKPVKPNVNIRPVLPTGPIKVINKVTKELTAIRNFQTSVVNTTKDYINLGTGNVIGVDFTGLIIGDNLNVNDSGIYVGDSVKITDTEVRITTVINNFPNFVSAGRDEVLSPFFDTIPVNYISAGRDAIRDLGSTIVINIVDAGRDIIN